MKRHEVMDLYFGHQKEVVEGLWNDVNESLPKKRNCKVRVKTIDGNETFAYFFADKCNFGPFVTHKSYFWQCVTKEELMNFTHWKDLKDD